MQTHYRLTLVWALLLGSSLAGLATPPGIHWLPGQLVLASGQTLTGDLAYNWAAEMVLFQRADGRVQTLSATQVQDFAWYDPAMHGYRFFVSVAGSVPTNPDAPAFFERMVSGPLSVYRRMRKPRGLVKRTFQHPERVNPDQPDAPDYYYDYFAEADGKLRSFDRFYSDVYVPILSTFDTELQTFRLRNHLDERSARSRMRLISYYNTLLTRQQASPTVAWQTSAPLD